MVKIRIADIDHSVKYDPVEKRDLSITKTTLEFLDDDGAVICTTVDKVIFPISKATWGKTDAE